jgi:hypothetical protein
MGLDPWDEPAVIAAQWCLPSRRQHSGSCVWERAKRQGRIEPPKNSRSNALAVKRRIEFDSTLVSVYEGTFRNRILRESLD